MLRKRIRDKITATPARWRARKAMAEKLAAVKFVDVFGLEPVAQNLYKFLDGDSTRSLMYTSKILYETFLPIAKRELYFKATPDDYTEDHGRLILGHPESRLENLHVNMDYCHLSAVVPLFEMFGVRLKKLIIKLGHENLSMSTFLNMLHLVPNIERIELQVVELTDGGSLAGCKNLPLLEKVSLLVIKHIIPNGLPELFNLKSSYVEPWSSDSVRALIDLLIVCPNLKQVSLYRDSLNIGRYHNFNIRYFYLRAGIIIDYGNVTSDEVFVNFPFRREENFQVLLGDPLYLRKFLHRRDNKTEKGCQIRYRGDTIEWTKAGVSAPPNFVAALSPVEVRRANKSGIVFANEDEGRHTEIIESDYNDSTSEESEEELEDEVKQVLHNPNSTQGQRCLCA